MIMITAISKQIFVHKISGGPLQLWYFDAITVIRWGMVKTIVDFRPCVISITFPMFPCYTLFRSHFCYLKKASTINYMFVFSLSQYLVEKSFFSAPMHLCQTLEVMKFLPSLVLTCMKFFLWCQWESKVGRLSLPSNVKWPFRNCLCLPKVFRKTLSLIKKLRPKQINLTWPALTHPALIKMSLKR